MNFKNRLSRNTKVGYRKTSPKVSTIVFLSTLVGYISLISYTWPQGFIPIVSVESLPFLLIGFALSTLATLFFIFILILPLYIYRNQDPLFEYLGDKVDLKQVTFIKACRSCKNKEEIFIAAWDLIAVAIMVLVSVSTWLWLFKESEWQGILFWVLWSSLTYLSLLFLIKKKGDILPLLVFFVVFLLVPILYSPLYNKNNLLGNNSVREGLQAVNLGGEVPIKIIPLGSDSVVVGLLLFYDGKKAWVKECNNDYTVKESVAAVKPKRVITEVIVSKIIYFEVGYNICQQKLSSKKPTN